MRKNLSGLRRFKQVATCALAVTIVATSTPNSIAFASSVDGTNVNIDTVVEAQESTIQNIEETSQTEVSTKESIEIIEEDVNSKSEDDQTLTEGENDESDVQSDSEDENNEIENSGIIVQEVINETESTETEKSEETDSISLDKSAVAIATGNSDQLTVTLSKNKTGTTVEFTSSDSNVATVDENGNITAVSAGEATIKATADDLTANCNVRVLDAGLYSINAQFRRADNLEVASSTNGAIESAKLRVNSNGTMEVYLNLQAFSPVAGLPIKANVSILWYAYHGDLVESEVLFVDGNNKPTQIKMDLYQNTEFTDIAFDANKTAAKLYLDYNSVSSIGFGSAATELEEGQYLVPVALMQAANPSATSMAGLALEGMGILIVSSDKTATLQTKWKTLEYAGLYANLTELGVYQSNTFNYDGAGVEYADIDTYRNYGNVEVPEKISIHIPNEMKSLDGIYVWTVTDLTGMNNPALLTIDYTNAQTFGISIDKTSLSVKAGETIQLAVNIPENSMDTTAVFTSSNTNVATVDANGKITAVAAGTATIIATANGVSATCMVTVQEKTVVKVEKTALITAINNAKAITNPYGIYLEASFAKLTNAITAAQAIYNNADATQSDVDAQVTALTNAINALEKSSITLSQTAGTIYTKIGITTLSFTATVIGDNKSVVWTSSNNAIATVSSDGVVTAKAAGTVTITASANGVSATAQVTVKVPSLTLSKSSGAVAVGGKITIGATSDPAGKITYKTSNKKIATVSSKGVVKGIKVGTAKITVTSNGISKTYKVTVKKQTLTLKKSSATITAGKTITINATASPTGTITYKTSNKKVATVNSKGVVKGVKAGTATITVKCNGVTKTYKVTVKKQTLTLKKTSASIKVGKTVAIKATASPKGTIQYKSSDTEIATVTSKGVVKGIKKGTAKITVTCNGVSKTFKVTVK